MPRIRILPESLSRRIAAGEVIERPASVVKELVENALDAGAKRIRVDLEEGGTALIRVKDDGEGMEREDLRICWRSHATSKISSEKDLLRITTFGFRGEALYSIAQVSRLTIVSRPREVEHGFRLEVEFGEEKGFRISSAAPGTLVEVRDLFFGFPARKAFLKSSRAEAGRALEVFKILSLGKPEVNYSFFHGGREIFSFSGGSRRRLLAHMLKLSEETLREESLEEKFFRVEVVLSDVSAALATPRYLFILVNDRVVKERRLVSALLEGVKGFFPTGRFPAGVIAVYLPPHLVDVNVHPAKLEVRFREEEGIYRMVRRLAERMFAPRVPVKRPDWGEEDISLPKDFSGSREPSFLSGTAPSLLRIKEPSPSLTLPQRGREGVGTWAQEISPGKSFRGFLRDTYLLFETLEGLFFLDFHALHERLIYEDLREKYQKGALERERLLFPVIVELSERAREKWLSEGTIWERLGFRVREVGSREVLVEEVPAGFGREAVEEWRGFLEESVHEPEKLFEDFLARIACRRARKAGERFSPEEALALWEALEKKGLSHCPHGRPLYFLLTWDELDRRFRRKT